MQAVNPRDRSDADFHDFKGDIEDAERRVAREIDPGARALVVAILVFVMLLSFLLPHTGGAKGLDVLIGDDAAISEAIALPSRGLHVAHPGIRRGFLHSRADHPSLGSGVDRTGRFGGGMSARHAGRVVAPDRRRSAPRAWIRPDHRVGSSDPADVPLGARGVVAHRGPVGRGGGAPQGRRREAGQGATRRARRRIGPTPTNAPALSASCPAPGRLPRPTRATGWRWSWPVRRPSCGPPPPPSRPASRTARREP